MQRGKDSSSIIARRVPQNDDDWSFGLPQRNFVRSQVIYNFTFSILHSSIAIEDEASCKMLLLK